MLHARNDGVKGEQARVAKTEAEIFEFWEPEEMKRFLTLRGWGQRDGRGGQSH